MRKWLDLLESLINESPEMPARWFWNVRTQEIVGVNTAHTRFAYEHPEALNLQGVPEPKHYGHDETVLGYVFDAGWVRCAESLSKQCLFVNAKSLEDAQACIRFFRKTYPDFVVDVGFDYNPLSKSLVGPVEVSNYLKMKSLSEAPGSPAQNFMDDLLASGRPGFHDPSVIVIGLASVDCRIYGDKEILLKSFTVTSYEREKGEGSRVLKIICDLADRHGVTIYGNAYPLRKMLGERHLKLDALVAWYGRHGFVVSKEPAANGVNIVRKPKKR